MTYSTFNRNQVNALTQPMFMGENVNVSRYDEQKHIVFEKLTEKQLSFFWRPEEVDLTKDKIDYNSMSTPEQHIFISNLKYQILLDSVQGRSPNVAFLPLVSIPELETWIETWSFSETIHSRSYTHILRNIFNDPSPAFMDITRNQHIIERANDVSKYYDELIWLTNVFNSLGEGTYLKNGVSVLVDKNAILEALYLCMCSVNALEAVRFYISFACTFAFIERELMEGNAKIMRLIARDEALHKVGTSAILNIWHNTKDCPEMHEVANRLKHKGRQIFLDAVEQEKSWADYLFSEGSMLGLNKEILCQYVEYIAHQAMDSIGLESPFEGGNNPLPWMSNYLESDNVQVAPQESEKSDYLVGAIDASLEVGDFDDIEL
jgi:ribonucleoside-diphosphate reductase beta chain